MFSENFDRPSDETYKPEKKTLHESSEKVPSRVELIEALKTSGPENPEVFEMLKKYVDEQETLARNINTNTGSANIECGIHMADIYFEAGYTEIALENLNDFKYAAQQEENTDLVERIDAEINLVIESLRK